MSKHGLQMVKSKRPEVITPEIMVDNAGVLKSALSKSEMSMEVTKGALDIARKIVDGRQQIEAIRANSDAEVAKIAAEIDRIAADAKAYVDKAHADSEAWHGKFEDRRKLAESFLSRLDAHPEWTDEIRAKIVEAAIAAIGVS